MELKFPFSPRLSELLTLMAAIDIVWVWQSRHDLAYVKRQRPCRCIVLYCIVLYSSPLSWYYQAALGRAFHHSLLQTTKFCPLFCHLLSGHGITRRTTTPLCSFQGDIHLNVTLWYSHTRLEHSYSIISDYTSEFYLATYLPYPEKTSP